MTEREIIKILKENTNTRFRDLPPEAQEWAKNHMGDIVYWWEAFYRLCADYPEPLDDLGEVHPTTQSATQSVTQPDRAELIELCKHNRVPWKWLASALKELMLSIDKQNWVVLGKRDGWWIFGSGGIVWDRGIYRIHESYTEVLREKVWTVCKTCAAYVPVVSAIGGCWRTAQHLAVHETGTCEYWHAHAGGKD